MEKLAVQNKVVIYPKKDSHSYRIFGKRIKGRLMNNDTELLAIRNEEDSSIYLIPVTEIEFLS